MNIAGASLIETLLAQPHFEAKCIFNADAVIFFAVSKQHRDVRENGLIYDDDYRGNAMAAMVKPGVIEVRHHKHFSDEAVLAIWGDMQAEPDASFLQGWKLTYQGREL